MSTIQKVDLVAAVVGEYPLASALAAVELPKSTWYYHQHHKVRSGEIRHMIPPVQNTLNLFLMTTSKTL